MIIHDSATVDPSAVFGPNTCIGPNCVIEAGVKIENATVLGDTVVKAHSLIKGSIIGWKNTVGSWVRITNMTCTAADVQIKPETLLDCVKVLPHKGVDGEHRNEIIM